LNATATNQSTHARTSTIPFNPFPCPCHHLIGTPFIMADNDHLIILLISSTIHCPSSAENHTTQSNDNENGCPFMTVTRPLLSMTDAHFHIRSCSRITVELTPKPTKHQKTHGHSKPTYCCTQHYPGMETKKKNLVWMPATILLILQQHPFHIVPFPRPSVIS